jgi:hypothetical protein
MSTLLGVAALLGSPDHFAAAGSFPLTLPENEGPVQSAGVFQITLTDPNMIALMNPDATHTLQYVGWDPVGFTVTSPLVYDPDTHISVSSVHRREVAAPPTYFPVSVGQTSGTLGVDYDTIGTATAGPDQYYNDYVYPAPLSDGFDFTAIYALNSGPNEVLTEIQKFSLYPLGGCGGAGSNGPPPPPQLPPANSWSTLGANFPLVRAGYNNTYNGSSTPYLNHSIGMVQSKQHPGTGFPAANDFPADSFFNIFVEITLPPIPGSISGDAFPALSGAVLTNTLPLIITATDLPGLPPSVVYTHTGSPDNQFTVPLKFKDDGQINPNTGMPYYLAGSTFGTIVLAGHGLLDPCAKSGSNLSNFVNAVFGLPGQLALRGLVGRHFTNDLFPSTPSLYVSAPGTNFGGGSVDAVQFTNGSTILRARGFRVGGFANPIPLPALDTSVNYTNPNTVVTFEISTDGINFIPAAGTGQMEVLIINSNNPAGNTRYYTELQALNISGSSGIETFKMRESPTKASLGKQVVEDDGGGDFTIGGYFDTSFEYSFNNGISYKPGNRPIRVEQNTSTECGAPGPMAVKISGPSSVTLSWLGSTFRLQGSINLSPASWVDIAGGSPMTISTAGPYRFFRLICP